MHNSDTEMHMLMHVQSKKICQLHVQHWLRIIQAKIAFIFQCFCCLYYEPICTEIHFNCAEFSAQHEAQFGGFSGY